MGITNIQWCDYTHNPWSGCTKVAAGCTNCYAETNYSVLMRGVKWGPRGTRVKAASATWLEPQKWNRKADPLKRTRKMKDPVSILANAAIELQFEYRPKVFCASLSDVFEDWDGPIVDHNGRELFRFPDGVDNAEGDECFSCGEGQLGDMGGGTIGLRCNRCGFATHGGQGGMRSTTMNDLRNDLFKMIDATPHLDWLILTKRPENIRRMWGIPKPLPENEGRPNYLRRDNVWLGCSVATQEDANRDIPTLLRCRDLAPVLFVSAEPLIEAVNLDTLGRGGPPRWLTGETDHNDPRLDWIIVGGESGPYARDFELQWATSIVEQCKAAGVACFVKQLGSKPVKVFGKTAIHGEFRDKKGGDPSEWPDDLRVREFPNPTVTA